MAVRLDGRRHARVGLQGSERITVPTQCPTVAAVGRGAGGRSRALRLGTGPALDRGTGRDIDRAAFHVRYTVRGATHLLHRLGFSAQVSAHRAAERDDADVEAWQLSAWPEIKG